MTKSNQNELKVTMALLQDTKKNLKYVPFTKIVG